MSERVIRRRPIIRPVVVCRENPDGSLSWPCACGGFSHWHVGRTLADIPEGYLAPTATTGPAAPEQLALLEL
jgi:hypothetical protein